MRLALIAALILAACLAGSAGDLTPLAGANTPVVQVGALAVPPTADAQTTAAAAGTTAATSSSAAAASTTSLPVAGAVTSTSTTVSTSALATTTTGGRSVQIASATTSPPTAGRCVGQSGLLRTTSGRHAVLRATGLVGPSPTIIVMHGYTGSPDGIERFSELTAAANSAGVAVMYPEGTPTPSGGFGWSTGAGLFATSGTDDVEALQEMIASAVSTGCVDATRVIISGESNGAGMALVALCDHRLQNTFAAAVLVIPAIDDAVLAHCDPAHAVPIGMSVVAGRLDQTVGYNGDHPPFLPAERWFQAAGSLVNACAPNAPERTPVDALVERLVMSGCAACAEMFAVGDGTHTWPGSLEGTGGQIPGTFALNQRLIDLALNREATCLE